MKFTKYNFNAKEIDLSKVKERAKKEAEKIFKNPKTARGRTLSKIIEDCMWGQCPEIWLMLQGYHDDIRDYHDLVDPKGRPIEVKATENLPYGKDGMTGIDFVKRRYAEKMQQGWGDCATRMYIFTYVKSTLEYTFEGIYDWDKQTKDFIRSDPKLITANCDLQTAITSV